MSSQIISNKFLIEILQYQQTKQVLIILNFIDKSMDRFARLKCILHLLNTQIPISHFTSIEDIYHFMKQQSNYSWNQQTHQMQLIWKVEAHEYKKIHKFCLKFQQDNSNDQSNLQYQNKFLRIQAKFLKQQLNIKHSSVNHVNQKLLNVLQEQENSHMQQEQTHKQLQVQQDIPPKKLRRCAKSSRTKSKLLSQLKSSQDKQPILMKDRKLSVIKTPQNMADKKSKIENPVKRKKIKKQQKQQVKKKIIKFKNKQPFYHDQSHSDNSWSSNYSKNYIYKKQKSYYPIAKEKKRVSIGENKYEIQYINGDTYVGEIKNNKFNGQGTYTQKSYIFKGTWKNSDTEGPGTFYFKNGGIESGIYKSGCKRYGQGSDKYENGESYVGEFFNQKKNGKGKYIFVNGDYYQGEWKNNKQHGAGTEYLSNGDKYVGQWHKDQKHGHFLFYSKEGKRQQVWERGVLKSQIICLGSSEDE